MIYSDALTDPGYVAAFWAAARELGAEAVQVSVTAIPLSGSGRVENRTVVSERMTTALSAANIVIDISSGGLLYSDARNDLLKAGSRILRAREPWDVLRRLIPDPLVKLRSINGAKRLAEARTIQIRSRAGTNLKVQKGDRPVECQYGAADLAGRWDHWPSGMVYCAPLEETLEGELVIDRGDLLFPPNLYVRDPIHCVFKDGVMTKMEGGADAVIFKEYLYRSGNSNCLRLAHLGWGTEHRARWETFAIRGHAGGGSVEARSHYGNVLFALGENRDLGGSNDAPVHTDIALRCASLELDGKTIVEDGKIVAEGLS